MGGSPTGLIGTKLPRRLKMSISTLKFNIRDFDLGTIVGVVEVDYNPNNGDVPDDGVRLDGVVVKDGDEVRLSKFHLSLGRLYEIATEATMDRLSDYPEERTNLRYVPDPDKTKYILELK
jgi:hypothetical protein